MSTLTVWTRHGDVINVTLPAGDCEVTWLRWPLTGSGRLTITDERGYTIASIPSATGWRRNP